MKNAIIYINDTEAQVTKAFAKQARIFGTPEYKLWKEYRKDFPEAQMVTKTIKKNASKRTYKNLTYANMERFLKSQDNALRLRKKLLPSSRTPTAPYWLGSFRPSRITIITRLSLPEKILRTKKPLSM